MPLPILRKNSKDKISLSGLMQKSLKVVTANSLPLLVLASFPTTVRAVALNPLDFTSLGSLNLTTPNTIYTIETNGIPVLKDSSNNILFTGTTFNQGSGFNPILSVLPFDSISIGQNVRINVTGNNPLALLSQSSISIDGILDGSGKKGEELGGGTGGAGGPGGGAGGFGGFRCCGSFNGPGDPGFGPGGGPKSPAGLPAFGFGGGFGGQGGNGFGEVGGLPYGDLKQFVEAGSGGGGSGPNLFGTPGAGGGGGGGAIEIGAATSISGSGKIVVDGGEAGEGLAALAGGGSGGGLFFHAPTIGFFSPSSILASGASYGGGGGRILFQTSTGLLTNPPANLAANAGPGSPSTHGVIEYGILSYGPTPPVPPVTNNFVAEFTTGSPATLAQIVTGTLPTSSFNLTFDTLFKTTTGALQVFLDGTLLTTLDAPSILPSAFSPSSIPIDGSLFAGTSHELSFILDGLTGSDVLLDNVVFANLVNGNFQTGSIAPWVTGGAGTVAIVPFQSVPEPSGILSLGLLGLGLVGRKLTKG